MLLAAAILLIGAGTAIAAARWLAQEARREGISGHVLPELAAASHIEAEPGSLRGFNVLVITTDTTRADHIAAYGNRSVETPNLDALARDGVLFADAMTPSPSTLPAHSSLLTGLSPQHHGARANGTFRLDDGVTTLAERLGAEGYRTGAVVSAFVLDSRFGLDQGFEWYHDDLTRGVKLSPHSFRERPAELANEVAIEWLRESPAEPFFLWLHYFDPHAAYLPPEPFRSRYADDLYDGEIAYADAQIGLLMAELERLGVRDETLVIYTADHGEGLGEHGETTHSLLTYQGTLHVPLILSAPAVLPRGQVIEREAVLQDVAPTVLALLGLEVPAGLDGRSLIEAPPEAARSIYFETIASMTLHGWAPLMGVRRGDHKFILAPTPELYDLRADPTESENLYEREPELAAALHAELVEHVGGDPLVAAPVIANLELDAETREHLASLGYVQTTTAAAERDPRLDLDPKEMIHHWEKLQRGMNLRSQGRMAEALPILEECVEEVEGDVFARHVLATAYMMRGEYDGAMRVLERAAELEAHDEGIHLAMANVHLARSEPEAARRALDRALEIEPENANIQLAFGRLALLERDPDESMRRAERALAMDRGSSGAGALVQIGWLHLRAHRLIDARRAFESALEIDAFSGAARDGLANLLILEDDLDRAAEMLAAALRFDPNQPRALATLASLMSRRGRHPQAIAIAERALELSPKFPEALNARGLIHRRMGELEQAEALYLQAIEAAPQFEKAHVNLAQLRLRQGETEAAIQGFRDALRANPWSRVGLANLGAWHFNEGRTDVALRFYARALQVDPDYALVHKHVASIHAAADRPAQAAHHLRRSLESDPDQPDAAGMAVELARADREAEERGGGLIEPAQATEGAPLARASGQGLACALPVVLSSGLNDIRERWWNGPEGFAFLLEAGAVKTGDIPRSVGRDPVREFDTDVYASNFQGPVRVKHPGLRPQWEWTADGELQRSERSYPLMPARRCAPAASALPEVTLHLGEHDEPPFENDELGAFAIPLARCDAVLAKGASGWSPGLRVEGLGPRGEEGPSDLAFVELALWCYRCPGNEDCGAGVLW